MATRSWPVILAMVVLAGCGTAGEIPPPDTGAAPVGTSSAPGTPTPASASPSPSGTATAVVSPTSRPSREPVAAEKRPCRASDLQGRAVGFSGRRVDVPNWSFATDYRLVNRSSTACAVKGWAGITMIGFDIHCPVDQECDPPDHTSRREQHVDRLDPGSTPAYTVDPGEYIPFSVLWNPAMTDACPGFFSSPYLVEVRVPDDHAPIRIRPANIQPCEGRVAVTALGVPA